MARRVSWDFAWSFSTISALGCCSAHDVLTAASESVHCVRLTEGWWLLGRTGDRQRSVVELAWN